VSESFHPAGLPVGRLAPVMCVYILGPPRVEWAGAPLAIPRRQARALCFYLAARSQPAPRDQLCLLLWPDLPEPAAHRQLTRLLTHLRRALPEPDILLSTGQAVQLDPARVWSDTAEVERLCAGRDPAHRADTLQQVVDLYRGPFLDGFAVPCPEFEAWSLRERSCFERLFLQALEDLIQERTCQGACDDAIAYAQRYLKTDELAETAHRHLIELYARTGNRAAALKQYESCVVTLERELGVSPLPETQAAYRAVFRGTPPDGPAAPPAWSTLPSLEAPLVGRDDALARLQEWFALASAGHGGVALVSGEPGIGKSRLLQEFAASVPGQAILVAGACHESEHGLPYWPLIEALRPHVCSINWAGLDLEPHTLSAIARVWPEVRKRAPGCPLPQADESGQEPGHLLQALVLWFERWAAQHPPLVLCVDDLHWADTATLTWLCYLCRRVRRLPILVVGAYRGEEAAAVILLRDELVRQGALREIRLAGLPAPEVLRLVTHLAGQARGMEQLSNYLHHETGGNPFFVLEMLHVLFESGSLRRDGADEVAQMIDNLPLPDSISSAILGRLSRLRPHVRQVLESGAVIGHQFTPETVRMTSGRREAEVINALDELAARQLIGEHAAASAGARTGSGDGAYSFRHELIRSVVYRQLSSGRRWLLHRRAGRALLKESPDDVPSLIWHLEQAEEWGDAARYALRAGQKSKLVFAYEQARTYFDKALALLEREAAALRAPAGVAANQRVRIQALDERGWVLRLLGDMTAYARDSQEVARLAVALGDRHTLAQMRWREASTHGWYCRFRQALDAAEEGARLSHAARDLLLEARCWREGGLAARELGDYPQARLRLEKAIRLFQQLGEPRFEVHALGNLSTLCLREGQYEQAMEFARQASARCDQAGLQLDRRLPLGDMGAIAAAAGNAVEARAWLVESLDIARKVADRTQEIFCHGHLGWLCARLNQPDEGLVHLQAALALAESIDSPAEQSWLQSGLAAVFRLKAAVSQAHAHALRALELAQAHGQPYCEHLARQALAAM
jgi:DNA-binding SARP family transcriptional activator/tetratricopeptide (TPR) repeat protein